MTEARLENIEIKLTQQEDLLDTLNAQIYAQQKKIDELSLLCAELAKRYRELVHNQMHSQTDNQTADQNQLGLVHEKPPHY